MIPRNRILVVYETFFWIHILVVLPMTRYVLGHTLHKSVTPVSRVVTISQSFRFVHVPLNFVKYSLVYLFNRIVLYEVSCGQL